MTIHIVRSGESVESIATTYGISPRLLSSNNAVPPSGALAVGQTLVIRFPRQVYTVRAGDTLTSIAATHGISVRQLWRNNWQLGGNDLLYPGQTLVISYQDEPQMSILANGYAYPFISSSLLAEQLPYLSHLTPFTYGITATGNLLPLADDALLSAARRRGTLPVMHLSTLTEDDRFDTARAELVLTNADVQSKLVGDVMQTVLRKGYAGVDVDFEYLPGSLAESYAAFLSRLRRLLTAHGLFLWAALAPKTSAGQRGLLYEGHSYPAVAAAADAVLLMTYEWGYTYQPCCYKQ